MLAADYIVDIGPGAGEHGGQVVATGNAQEIMKNPASITGAYLSGKIKIPVPTERKEPKGWLKVIGAEENNLKKINEWSMDDKAGIMPSDWWERRLQSA